MNCLLDTVESSINVFIVHLALRLANQVECVFLVFIPITCGRSEVWLFWSWSWQLWHCRICWYLRSYIRGWICDWCIDSLRNLRWISFSSSSWLLWRIPTWRSLSWNTVDSWCRHGWSCRWNIFICFWLCRFYIRQSRIRSTSLCLWLSSCISIRSESIVLLTIHLFKF